MQQVANRESNKIEITLEDLNSYFATNPGLVDRIKKNTKRYQDIFYKITDELMPERTTEKREEEEDTVHEIFMRQRKENIDSNLTALNNENIAPDDFR
jgi:DNA replicative helicase MCM subunit Mcm2 (Cdc46/Mcm family)